MVHSFPSSCAGQQQRGCTWAHWRQRMTKDPSEQGLHQHEGWEGSGAGRGGVGEEASKGEREKREGGR